MNLNLSVHSRLFMLIFSFSTCVVLIFTGCKPEPSSAGPMSAYAAPVAADVTPLDEYIQAEDTFSYEITNVMDGEGYTTYVVRMVSQTWLSEDELKDPLWWHWLTIVVPDQVSSQIGMLFIGGGSRNREMPEGASDMLVKPAMLTQTVVAELHNVPNQPIEFVGDDYGPRSEDEIIAYGWREFMERGGKEEDAAWLSRLPMTKSAVKAMDVITAATTDILDQPVENFMVAGGSKRGWTTWTTAATDDRVVAIAPIVIDLLNVIPSFEHHWQVYGFWAPAVGNYVNEGIMEWQNAIEYQRLLEITEPFSYRNRLTMPKLILNATGDQFFIPDSWQFYWDELKGEKHLRYVPNSEHSMDGTDVLETLVSFYQHIVTGTERPDFDWEVVDHEIVIRTLEEFPPQAITLWKATNPQSRDFRVDKIGLAYEPVEIPLNERGEYRLSVEEPAEGWTAFFGELTFEGIGEVPFKQSTGVVVVPEVYPYEPYVSSEPQGTKIN